MKYSEYLQLSEVVDINGNSLFKELGLNEANETIAGKPEDVETEKGNLFTKWGRIKRTLNKTAKRTQDQVTEKIINKYLPNVLKLERSVTTALAEAIKENKKGEELKKILNNKIKTTSNLQKRQLDAIYGAVDKFLSNADAAFDKKISNAETSSTITGILDATAAFFKGGKDAAALKLKNYWQLLHTQIQMNAYSYISKTIEADARKVLTNEEAYKLYDESSYANRYNDEKIQETTTQTEEQKAKIQKDQEEAQTEKQTPKLEVGKKYKINIKGIGEKEVVIVSVDDKLITYKIVGEKENNQCDIKYAKSFEGPLTDETKVEGEQTGKLA